MAKNLGRLLATTAVAGLALFGSVQNAKALTGPIEVTTKVSGGSYGGATDQDTNRPGNQIRFDWIVVNNSGTNREENQLWGYTIEADLLNERKMYGFTSYTDYYNNSWPSELVDGSKYRWLANGNMVQPIWPGESNTFTAFIDETNLLGVVNGNSYGMSNAGQTESASVGIPALPFPNRIYLDMDSKKLKWFSPSNTLGRKFIVDRKTNLMSSAWTAVQTNVHSATNTKYEYIITNNFSKAFFRVRETN